MHGVMTAEERKGLCSGRAEKTMSYRTVDRSEAARECLEDPRFREQQYAGSSIRKSRESRKIIGYTDIEGGSLVTQQGKEWREKVRKAMEERAVIEKSFNQMTVDLMTYKNITVEKLAEKTGLSTETIKNMRNNPAKIIKIEEIVAVCIALHLSKETSREYIGRSPSKFLPTDENYCYMYALMEWSDLSVAEVNRRLIESGIKPLTNLVSGLDTEIFARRS